MFLHHLCVMLFTALKNMGKTMHMATLLQSVDHFFYIIMFNTVEPLCEGFVLIFFVVNDSSAYKHFCEPRMNVTSISFVDHAFLNQILGESQSLWKHPKTQINM